MTVLDEKKLRLTWPLNRDIVIRDLIRDIVV